MKEHAQLPLIDRLRAITAYLPAFQQQQSTKPLDDFVQAAYKYGWVSKSDWPEWKQTPEAIALWNDKLALAQATEEQLIGLITTCIRQDRFVEGMLIDLYESGFLTRILERADSMEQALEAADRAL